MAEEELGELLRWMAPGVGVFKYYLDTFLEKQKINKYRYKERIRRIPRQTSILPLDIDVYAASNSLYRSRIPHRAVVLQHHDVFERFVVHIPA